MTESRRLRSGFARPWYQPPPPRQRPSAPAAPAAPVAPATGPPPVPRHESRKEDPNKAPVVEKCGHTIHPAYAEFYPHLLCPLCRLEKTINEALRPAQILMERGGQVAWNNDILATTEKDSIEREQAKKFFHSIVPQSRKKAGKPKPFDLHVDEDGNISFPRARSGAWNRIRELEMFRDAEVAWYGLCPYEKVDEPLRVRVHDAWKHDALNALTRWEKKHREAVSDRVIKQMRIRNLTQEQKEWAEARNAAEGWTLKSGECPQQTSLPPRKRRRVGLRFDDQIYVRSDYALDSGLFRPRQTGSDAAPSSNPPPPVGDHMNPPPARPYYTVPTKKNSNRKKGIKRHERRITIEDNRIDTSGGWRQNKDWDMWDAYTAALEAEDERSEARKEIETELLRLYDLVARLRRSGQKTESTEVLIRAYERLARAPEVASEDPEDQLRREMADKERRRGGQPQQLQQPVPRGGMAIAVAWVERARGIAQEYLRRLAENTEL